MIKVQVTTADEPEAAHQFSDYFSFETLPRIGDKLFLEAKDRCWSLEVVWVQHYAIPQKPTDFNGGCTVLGCRVLKVMDAHV